MNKEDDIEYLWFLFSEDAKRKLHHCSLPGTYLQFEVNPSFGTLERLFVGREKGNIVWQYAFWEQQEEYNRIKLDRMEQVKLKYGRLTPDIHRVLGTLDQEAYAATDIALQHLVINPMGEAGISGLDGTTYTLIFGGGFCHSSFSWWEQLPQCWSPLASIVNEVMANLELAREMAKGHRKG